jgi:hypothetical protein
MSVASTSLSAYDTIKPKIGKKQKIVYDAIDELGTASNEQLADYLNWPINTVTPRVCELRMLGMVGLEGFKKSKSGMKVKAWGVRDNGDNALLRLIREAEG